MLNGLLPVAVQNRGGETEFLLIVHQEQALITRSERDSDSAGSVPYPQSLPWDSHAQIRYDRTWRSIRGFF